MAKKQVTESQYPREGYASVPDAARFLNVSKHTIYRLINSAKLNAIEVGVQKRIMWADLHSFGRSA